MALYSPANSTEANLQILGENPQPGSLIVAGRAGEIAVQAFVLAGHTFHSRNQRLVVEDGVVCTAAIDRTRPHVDTALTSHDVMRRAGSRYVIGNGKQVTTAVEFQRSGRSFDEAMSLYDPTPDDDSTPRITAVTDFVAGSIWTTISVVRLNRRDLTTIRSTFRYGTRDSELADHTGRAVHAYDVSNGIPQFVPSFEDKPFVIPVEDTAESMAQMLAATLNIEMVAAIAARTITPDGQTDTHIINRSDMSAVA